MNEISNISSEKKKLSVTVKNIIRTLTFCCVILFFCPMFMVSCSDSDWGVDTDLIKVSAVTAIKGISNIVIPKLKNKRKNTIPKRFTTCGIVRLLLSLSSISVFTTSSLVFPSSSSGLADTRASTRSVPISSALLLPNCRSSHGCCT